MVRHSCNNCNTNHTISQVENLRHSCDCSYNNLMTNLKTFCKSGHCSSCCCSSSSWSSLFKKPQRSVVSNWIGMKFGRIFPGVIMHRLRESFFKFTFYSQDSDHDIISRKSLRLRLHHYNSDLDEIWQECSFSKYASTDKTRIFDLMSHFENTPTATTSRSKGNHVTACQCHESYSVVILMYL